MIFERVHVARGKGVRVDRVIHKLFHLLGFGYSPLPGVTGRVFFTRT